MKKYLALAVLLTLAVLSCQKGRSALSQEEDLAAPVPIRFGTNLAVAAQSKAAGPLTGWNAEKIYVYGIRRSNEITSPLALDLQNRQIDRVEAVAPTGSERTGEIQVYNRAAGDSEPFYYDASMRYDFFAYYVDDAVLSPAPTEADKTPDDAVLDNTITYTVTIDGTQDIMLGRAFPGNDILKQQTPAGKSSISALQAYSAVAARRQVHPDIVFFHKLSRLSFHVQTGFKDDDARADKITIAGLKVKSKNQAEMDVVAVDTTAKETKDFRPKTGTETDLLLHVASEREGLVPLSRANAVTPKEALKDLGEMMVMPGESRYEVEVTLHQEGYTVQDEFTIKLNIDFPDGTVSQPGYQYDVNLTVWGLEDIKVAVTMKEWIPGNAENPFVLDPDSDETNS